jgi:hypothetical protein
MNTLQLPRWAAWPLTTRRRSRTPKKMKSGVNQPADYPSCLGADQKEEVSHQRDRPAHLALEADLEPRAREQEREVRWMEDQNRTRS